MAYIVNTTQTATPGDLVNIERLGKISAAAAGGKVSGAAGPVITIRDVDDTVDAIVGTFDADGNRTAVSYGV